MPPKKRSGSDDASAEGDDQQRSESPHMASKRQRVSRACDQCRAAREKCSGERNCHQCVSQNRPCTYETSPKKRGVQTGYIRTLEVALAWVFDTVPESEKSLIGIMTKQGGEAKSLLAGKDTNRFHKKWRKSRVHKEIDRILSGGNICSQQHDEAVFSEDISETEAEADRDDTQPSLLQGASDIPRLIPTSPGSTTQYSFPGRPTSSRSFQQYPGTTLVPPEPSPCLAKLPANHWRLLDIYFSYTHCWLPILEKQDIFQASYRYSSDPSRALSAEDPSAAAYAELWSALALASFQDAASSTPKTAASNGEETLSADEIFRIARNLIPSEEGPFHISHCRALLILALVSVGRNNLSSAWILVGTAIRIFMSLTAPRDYDQLRLRSVIAAFFIVDTIVSAIYEKPTQLRMEDLVNVLPVPDNGLDEWQPWTPCDGFGSSGPTPSSQARNPAHCLSTFNQLYLMCKIISQNINPGRRGRISTPANPGSFAAAALQQCFESSPFRSFVLSPSQTAASVPSPYILRVVFLWAIQSLDETSNYHNLAIAETVEEYAAKFGACGVPPLFTVCLSPTTAEPAMAGNSPEKENFNALRSRLMAIWSTTGHPRSQQRFPVQQNPQSRIGQFIEAPRAAEPVSEWPNAFSVPTPSSFYNNSNNSDLTPQRALPGPDGNMFSNIHPTYMLSPYESSKQLNTPPPTSLIHDTGESIAHSDMAGIVPPVLDPIQQQQQQQQQKSLANQATFAVTTMDYDALLDDLASIDYGDRAEVDPQFMMNLGFAPGCDLTEILTRDFGAG